MRTMDVELDDCQSHIVDGFLRYQMKLEEWMNEENKRKKRQGRPWVRSWIQHRECLGGSRLIRELHEEDPACFRSAMRMHSDTFDELLFLVKDSIQKEDTVMRESIPAKVKLEVTLWYLATGDLFGSLSLFFQYLAIRLDPYHYSSVCRNLLFPHSCLMSYVLFMKL